MTRHEAPHAELLDVALHDEIELVSDLVVAASSSPRHLTTEEIDTLLGLHPKALAPPERARRPRAHGRHTAER